MKKFMFDEPKLRLLNEFLDITLRSTGLQSLNIVNHIIKLFTSETISVEDDIKIISLSDDDISIIIDLLDIVLKTSGLNSISNVNFMINHLNSPMLETVSTNDIRIYE